MKIRKKQALYMILNFAQKYEKLDRIMMDGDHPWPHKSVL